MNMSSLLYVMTLMVTPGLLHQQVNVRIYMTTTLPPSPSLLTMLAKVLCIFVVCSTRNIFSVAISFADDDLEPGSQRQYSLNDFELIRVIGRGSYAKVLMVELKKTRRIYAMKVIKKALVTDDEVNLFFFFLDFLWLLFIRDGFGDSSLDTQGIGMKFFGNFI